MDRTAGEVKVGYDEQVFLAQARGGISRYIVELVKAFDAHPDLGVAPVPGWSYTPNDHADEAGLSRRLAAVDRYLSVPLLAQGAYFVGNSRRRRAARRADILHHTYTHPRFLSPKFKGLRVCTVYDMIPELYPETFSGRNPHLAKKRYVDESDVVICISESTRRDLVQVYGDPGVPMPITYLGVGDGFAPGLPGLPGLPERFFLFVGRREGYKDFAVLTEAFANLPDDGTALVVVGGDPFSEDETRRLQTLNIASRVIRLDATDVELPRIYASALAFVFPSRHEGFGLPTLEAMASGTAVVLARSSSHPEVGGDVARYFPPMDVEALGGVLAELQDDSRLRHDLGNRGVERAAKFTWKAAARATAAVYQSASARAFSSR